MKANIHFSNGQIVVFDGIKSLLHAQEVANITASHFSASYGKAIYVSVVSIDSNNFSSNPSPDYWMEGVELVSCAAEKSIVRKIRL